MSQDNSNALEEVKMMAERAGLRLTDEEAAELEPLYSSFQGHLKLLHEVDLGDAGPEVAFSAQWPSER